MTIPLQPIEKTDAYRHAARAKYEGGDYTRRIQISEDAHVWPDSLRTDGAWVAANVWVQDTELGQQ